MLGAPHTGKVGRASHTGGGHFRGRSTAAPIAVAHQFRAAGLGGMSGELKVARTEIVPMQIYNTKMFSVNHSISLGAQIDGLLINPGNPNLSAWLNSISRMFEGFQFTSLTFTYVPSCPTTTLGNICLVFDPDPFDSAEATMVMAHQKAGAVTGAMWEELTLRIPKPYLERLTNAKFVDTLGDGIDYSHQVGRLFLYTTNGDVTPIETGYLRVSYSVVLSTPQVEQQLGSRYATWYTAAYGLAPVSTWLGNCVSSPGSNAADAGITPGTYNGLWPAVTFADGVNGMFKLTLGCGAPTGQYIANIIFETGGEPTLSGGVSFVSALAVAPHFGSPAHQSYTSVPTVAAFVPIMYEVTVYVNGKGGAIILPKFSPSGGGEAYHDLVLTEFPHGVMLSECYNVQRVVAEPQRTHPAIIYPDGKEPTVEPSGGPDDNAEVYESASDDGLVDIPPVLSRAPSRRKVTPPTDR